jgi:hypothetical protein
VLCRAAFPTAHELNDKHLQQVLQRQLRLYTTGALLGNTLADAQALYMQPQRLCRLSSNAHKLPAM